MILSVFFHVSYISLYSTTCLHGTRYAVIFGLLPMFLSESLLGHKLSNNVIIGSSTQLTPLQLEALLTEGGTSRFWLVRLTIYVDIFVLMRVISPFYTICTIDLLFWQVEFRSSFSSTCIRTSRVLPELSITWEYNSDY